MNNSSANIKLSKIVQSEGFVGRLLSPSKRVGLPLMKNVLAPIAKSVLKPLGLTTAASATDAAIKKRIYVSSMTVLIISKEEMADNMKIVTSLKESVLLIKGVSTIIENKAKEQKVGFLGLLLSTLYATLLGNLVTGERVIRAGEWNIRARQDF